MEVVFAQQAFGRKHGGGVADGERATTLLICTDNEIIGAIHEGICAQRRSGVSTVPGQAGKGWLTVKGFRGSAGRRPAVYFGIGNRKV